MRPPPNAPREPRIPAAELRLEAMREALPERPPRRGAAAACLRAALLALLASCAPAPERVNLVLVTIDTLRADHLEPYGYERATTPYLRELANESFVFTDAVSQCGTTPQALSALMTGRYPYTDGVVGSQAELVYLRAESTTLAARLGAAGYRTHAITSSVQSSVATGMNLGFESFDGVEVGVRGARIQRRNADQITDLALAWLREHAGSGRPFFLWLHYLDPHHPYTAPPGYRNFFAEYAPKQEGETRHYRFDERRSTRYPLSDGDLGRLVIEYDREIRHVDDALRRLIELGLRPHLGRTLFVLTADHGEALGNHAIVTHNDLYQTILRVPLFVRLPGAPRSGERVDHPVMLVDVLPTVLDWLGLPAADADELRGTSLRPWLEGKAAAATAQERFRLGEYADQALFLGQLKLIRRGGRRELYDLARDPYEQRDLAGEHPELAERLVTLAPARQGGAAAASGPGVEISPEMLEELRALGYAGEPEDAP